MNTNIFKISLLTVVISLVTSTTAEAYRFVDSTSTKINDTTYLLTHTYTLGYLNADVQTPVLAGQEEISSYGTEQTTFSVAGGEYDNIRAIILSGETIVGNQYTVKSGTTPTFTLMALVTGVSLDVADLKITLDRMPYSYIRNGEDDKQVSAYIFE